MKAKSLNCPNCGAGFNPEKHKCDYCGSYIFVEEEKQFNVPESVFNDMTNAPGIYVHGKLLGKGEIPLRIGLANYYTSKFIGVGGKLFLTGSNLYFSAHHVLQDALELCIPLKEIKNVTLDRNFFVSQHISVHTDEKKYTFVVYGGKEWIRMINSASGLV